VQHDLLQRLNNYGKDDEATSETNVKEDMAIFVEILLGRWECSEWLQGNVRVTGVQG